MLNHKGKKVKISFWGVVIVSNSNMHVIAQHKRNNMISKIHLTLYLNFQVYNNDPDKKLDV